MITLQQKFTIERIINCFETSSEEGDYSKVTLLDDAPDGSKQVTYGRSQVTEHGQLKALLQNYSGLYATDLAQYIPLIKTGVLARNKEFHALLKKAGKTDPLMKQSQDYLFDKHYYGPAVEWATTMGFTLPLSVLVIYDSFIHSGKIRQSLRDSFAEPVPNAGGLEKTWVSEYVNARHMWFQSSLNPILRNCVYRTQCFKNQIATGNWLLDQRPILAHGVVIR